MFFASSIALELSAASKLMGFGLCYACIPSLFVFGKHNSDRPTRLGIPASSSTGKKISSSLA